MCTFIAFSFYSFKTLEEMEQRERGLETQQEDSKHLTHKMRNKLIFIAAYSNRQETGRGRRRKKQRNVPGESSDDHLGESHDCSNVMTFHHVAPGFGRWWPEVFSLAFKLTLCVSSFFAMENGFKYPKRRRIKNSLTSAIAHRQEEALDKRL